VSVDPKILLLAIYYHGLSEAHKQQLLDYSHELTERQRAEQCADDDDMSIAA
jgi:hypothetical protein